MGARASRPAAAAAKPSAKQQRVREKKEEEHPRFAPWHADRVLACAQATSYIHLLQNSDRGEGEEGEDEANVDLVALRALVAQLDPAERDVHLRCAWALRYHHALREAGHNPLAVHLDLESAVLYAQSKNQPFFFEADSRAICARLASTEEPFARWALDQLTWYQYNGLVLWLDLQLDPAHLFDEGVSPLFWQGVRARLVRWWEQRKGAINAAMQRQQQEAAAARARKARFFCCLCEVARG